MYESSVRKILSPFLRSAEISHQTVRAAVSLDTQLSVNRGKHGGRATTQEFASEEVSVILKHSRRIIHNVVTYN